jgi:uncharacterized protein YraI
MLLLFMSAFSAVVMAQGSSEAQVRFMHAIPAASAIDVYTDGELTVAGLNFGEATGYIKVPAGEHTVVVTPAGLTTTLWQQPLNAPAGSAQTLIASTTDPLGFTAYSEDLAPLQLGNMRLLVVHAVAGGPAIDVVLEQGDVIVPNLAAGQPFGPFDVGANVYEMAVVETGESADNALVPLESYSFNGGTSYVMVVYGVSTNPSVKLLSTPTTVADSFGVMRLVHGVAGAPAVDVFINDTLVAPALSFGQSTAHIALAIGDYQVVVRAEGTDLVNANLTIQDGGAGTVAIVGSPDDIALAAFADNVQDITPDQALVSVINTIPGESSVTVTLDDGTALAEDVAFGKSSDVVSVDPTKQGGNVTISLDGQSGTVELPAQTLYGGVYYNAIAFAGTAFSPPTVIFEPTNLAQGIASAPGDSTVSVVSAPTEVAPQPTQPPAVVETQAPPVVPTQTQTTTTAGPTARVLLNPDANLNLRLYPSADALTLGGAPSGTVLVVNGRDGEPALLEGQSPDPNATPFIDPATLLTDEDADLDPNTTWLNVTYNTPDGGTITAWVNALYVELRDEKGNLMKLRDLATVPNNIAGEVSNTALTPPPIPEDRVTVTVFNLDPGVNLNIRRIPDTAGERLHGIPSGTVAEFVGMHESGEWAFIRYTPAEGGTITGWVSTQYVEYSYRGRKVTLIELEQRGLIELVESDRIGEVSAGAVTAPLPTKDPIEDAFVADPNVNPDVNLNLRRTPDQVSEVIARIPASARLIVTGRTVEGDWLKTEFEGQTGWIASEFVLLTFNGQPVTPLDVPLDPSTTTAPAG